MIIATESRTTKVTPERIWQVWSDVKNWKTWDNQVEFSELSGPMSNGISGVLKPSGGPKTRFIVSDCIENKCFTSISSLPLCRMKFIHTIEDKEQRRVVTHRIEMVGPLTFLFSRILGPKIKEGLPDALDNLIFNAENI